MYPGQYDQLGAALQSPQLCSAMDSQAKAFMYSNMMAGSAFHVPRPSSSSDSRSTGSDPDQSVDHSGKQSSSSNTFGDKLSGGSNNTSDESSRDTPKASKVLYRTEPMKVNISSTGGFCRQQSSQLRSSALQLQQALSEWESCMKHISPFDQAANANVSTISSMINALSSTLVSSSAAQTAFHTETKFQRRSHKSEQQMAYHTPCRSRFSTEEQVLSESSSLSFEEQLTNCFASWLPRELATPVFEDQLTSYQLPPQFDLMQTTAHPPGLVAKAESVVDHGEQQQPAAAGYSRGHKKEKRNSKQGNPPSTQRPTQHSSKGSGAPPRCTMNSLRTNLEELKSIDASKVVIARKIEGLGFEAPHFLDLYFAHFGKIERILLVHRSMKVRDTRVRPCAHCFLVMETTEAADAILASGPNHRVWKGGAGDDMASVNTRPFKPQEDMENDK